MNVHNTATFERQPGTLIVEMFPAELEYFRFLVNNKVKDEAKPYISQNQAYKRFGRSNVELWRNKQKVKAYYRMNKIEYELAELLKAARNRQDYLL